MNKFVLNIKRNKNGVIYAELHDRRDPNDHHLVYAGKLEDVANLFLQLASHNEVADLYDGSPPVSEVKA